MAKITVHDGESFDPYAFPELQTTIGPTVVETDIKEVADADKDVEYKPEEKEEGDAPSVGTSFLTSTTKTDKTSKKADSRKNTSALNVESNYK